MIFENAGDFERCINVVKLKLNAGNIVVSDKVLHEITRDIMNISYAKGGGYSPDIIAAFTDGYIEHGLFKKYMENE
ncbi:MAG: hypothetical protein IJ661_12725 [Lachnospiraceae bacterium]|nr:hypothetical protein [Lachnospiraceae bacterium]